MHWKELIIETNTEGGELFAYMLTEMGADGVIVEDPHDLETLTDDGFGIVKPEVADVYASEAVLVKAYFQEDVEEQHIEEALQEQIQAYGDAVPGGWEFQWAYQEVSDNWEEEWRAQHKPIHITERIIIVPSWIEYVPNLRELVITIDPGIAFGTGDHGTTRLAMEALEAHLQEGDSLLDVGTGTGILAMAGKLLGASTVKACDLDEQAVKVAQDMVSLNGLAQDVEVFQQDLLKGWTEPMDVIIANIVVDILVQLVDDSWHALAPKGRLILSGIDDERQDEIVPLLLQRGYTIIDFFTAEGWAAMVCEKP